MKKGMLALLVIGACWGAPLQAQDWEDAPLAQVQEAAEQGDVEAQFILGVRYWKGKGVAQDDKQAVAWLLKAAEQGQSEAQYNLGWMYNNGQGVAQNHKQAVAWYRKAAEQGFIYAQFNLGRMYENGEGVAQNAKQAVAWYRKAAEQGNTVAQLTLGVMYDNGQGVAQDYKQAVAWYRKAAKQGNAGAQRNLGAMYGSGQGVAQDNKLAYVWSSVAAANGNAGAVKNRDLAAQRLPPATLAEAQTLAGQYFEQYQAAEEAKLQKEMEAMRQQQLEAEANSSSQAASAASQGEVDKYAALIKATVERYMILDPTMRGKTCTIGVKLASSGVVISVDNGQGNPAICRSGKAAVWKANQLPVPKDPAAFEVLKEFNLKLEPNI